MTNRYILFENLLTNDFKSYIIQMKLMTESHNIIV